MAVILGVGPLADIFVLALMLPSLFRSITAEGALSAAFVPRYAGLRENAGQEAASRFARDVLAIVVLVLVPVTLLFFLLAPAVVWAMAPWLRADAALLPIAIDLARITFAYLILASVVALLGGLLNVHDRFAPMAASPVIFNLMIIAGAWAAVVAGGQVVYAMAWAVIGAGILQVAWMQVATAHAGVRLAWVRPRLHPQIKEFLRAMGPGVIAGGAAPISVLVDKVLASWLGSGNVSQLHYAVRMYQLPFALIAIALAVALIPTLSRRHAALDPAGAARFFATALLAALALSLPAAVGLALGGEIIVAGIFAYGAFAREAIGTVGLIMAVYGAGLPAMAITKMIASSFFAQRDTVTPVRLMLSSLALNITLSVTFVMIGWGIVGLALATSIAAWAHALAGWAVHHRRCGPLLPWECWRDLLALGGASLGMAAVLFFVREPLGAGISRWAAAWEWQGASAALTVVAFVGIGVVTYLALGTALGLARLARRTAQAA